MVLRGAVLQNGNGGRKRKVFRSGKKGNIGLSANYLNFNDLADCKYLKEKIHTMQEICGEKGIQIKTAMIADINGISMGQRDALIENGVEFLYTNIHTHHGMYPLYQNQKPYFWEMRTDSVCWYGMVSIITWEMPSASS